MGSQRTEVAGAEGSDAKSQPDDLPPPMSGFCGQRHSSDLVGPDVLARASSRSRRPTRGRSSSNAPSPSIWPALPFVSSAHFEGVRRAGSEHRKVSKPAYPKKYIRAGEGHAPSIPGRPTLQIPAGPLRGSGLGVSRANCCLKLARYDPGTQTSCMRRILHLPYGLWSNQSGSVHDRSSG